MNRFPRIRAREMVYSRKIMRQRSGGVCWVMGSVVVAGFAPIAESATLEPGQIEFLSGVDVSSDHTYTGATIEKLLIPFSVVADPAQGVIMNGILKQRVVRVDETDTLDFYYRVHVLSTETIGIGGLLTHGYADYFIDAEWRKDYPGRTAPQEASRSSDGNSIFFDFDDYFSRLSDDNYGSALVIRTDATEYHFGGSTEIQLLIPESPEKGSAPLYFGTAVLNTFQPGPAVTPVPLPAPLIGAAIGGTVCAGAVVRRARSSRK